MMELREGTDGREGEERKRWKLSRVRERKREERKKQGGRWDGREKNEKGIFVGEKR